MTATTRARPRSLPSTTTKLQTEMGSLFVTVSVDEDGDPFEVFGFLGKGGSFQHGVTELACRLISLHLRRGTPLEEVIDQIQGIQEMQPFFNTVGRQERGGPGVRRRHRPRPQGPCEGQGAEGCGTSGAGGRSESGRVSCQNNGAVSTGRPRVSSMGHKEAKTMVTTIDDRAEVFSRPAARFDDDGNIEVRASAALGCRRALWYAATEYAPTNPPSDDSLTAMEAGNALEPVVVRAMERAGWKVDAADPHDPQSVVVRVGPNLVVTGHPDATGRMPLPEERGGC